MKLKMQVFVCKILQTGPLTDLFHVCICADGSVLPQIFKTDFFHRDISLNINFPNEKYKPCFCSNEEAFLCFQRGIFIQASGFDCVTVHTYVSVGQLIFPCRHS